jgi:hypothetical protein
MVKLTKTPLPPGVGIKNESDYSNGIVWKLLVADCHNKCYVCEEKAPTSPEVEHLIPKSIDSSLKYVWENLLLSCHHCNNLKRESYNKIIDCTKDDPENYITLLLVSFDFKDKVVVKDKIGNAASAETCRLLDRIYNGGSNARMETGCQNLREHITDEIKNFYQAITEYSDETDTALKQNFRSLIIDKISRSSTFAAFKRDIVRQDADLIRDFKEALV